MIVPSSSRAFVVSHNSSLEFASLAKLSSGNLLAEVDLRRAVVSLKLRQDKKGSMGQFLTPASVAQLMAGMFNRLNSYLAEMAWETDVWVAEDSTHLIHFNGEYLLQTYQREKKQTS